MWPFSLEAARQDSAQGIITLDFVNKYIDQILVTPEDEGTMRLVIKIFTGETTEKIPEKSQTSCGSHVQEQGLTSLALVFGYGKS